MEGRAGEDVKMDIQKLALIISIMALIISVYNLISVL